MEVEISKKWRKYKYGGRGIKVRCSITIVGLYDLIYKANVNENHVIRYLNIGKYVNDTKYFAEFEGYCTSENHSDMVEKINKKADELIEKIKEVVQNLIETIEAHEELYHTVILPDDSVIKILL